MLKLRALERLVNEDSRGGWRAAGSMMRLLFGQLPRGRAPRIRGAALVLACMLQAALPAVTAAQERTDALVVRQLSFSGNDNISSQLLEASIETTKSALFARSGLLRWIGLGAKRYFNQRDFEQDVLRIEVLYKRSGFPAVQVDTLVERTAEDVFIAFNITEGEPIRVRELTVTGLDTLGPEVREGLEVDLPLMEGDIFNRAVMQASADTIAQRLRNRGYPSADVLVGYVVRTAELEARVTLDAIPGVRARIGSVAVQGEARVDPSTVVSLITARPGEWYSEDDLFQSQRNLYGANLFRLASVQLDTTRFVPGDEQVPLLVQVTESPPRRARASVGYGSNDCLRGSSGITFRDFFGGGRILDISGRVSKVGVGRPLDWGMEESLCSPIADDTIGSSLLNYGVTSALRRPAFLSPNNTLVMTGFVERRSEFKVYRRREIGASVGITRETPVRRLPVALTYTLLFGQTVASPFSFCAFFNSCEPVDIAFLSRTQRLASLSATATIPRANNPVDPTRGYVATAEVTVASRYIGSSSEQQFTRLLADYAWYHPVLRDVVLSWRVRGGMAFSPVQLAGSDVPFVPPEQRFYGGGPNDVRGYQRNQLGPVVYYATRAHVASKDLLGEPLDPDSVQIAATGGNTMAVGNLELRIPSPVFSERLRLAAFVDVGAVWQRGATPVDLRVTPGIGIRVSTPLGPARFDVAYNPMGLQQGQFYVVEPDGQLTADPGRSPYRLENRNEFTFHFAVGQPF